MTRLVVIACLLCGAWLSQAGEVPVIETRRGVDKEGWTHLVFAQPLSYRVGFGQLECFKNDGRICSIGGTQFRMAVYAHATSSIKYKLAGKYTRFQASYGLRTGAGGAAVFSVFADGKKVFGTGEIYSKGHHTEALGVRKPVDLDVTGVQVIELVADGVRGGAGAQSAWGDPKVRNDTGGREAPRLAVITKERDAAVSDLVFARLAAAPGIALVERDKLGAIANELELSAVSRSADVKAGALLGAQGLLFIEADANFRHFILVETRRGERLFDLVRPRDEPALAEAVEQVRRLVERNLPKLTETRSVVRHVAILPFEREDGIRPVWHDLDVLTVLVGSALAQHPGIVVVERENLADVTLEPALSSDVTNALETADFILRGSAVRTEPGRLKINLRLKPSRGGEMKAASFVAATDTLKACASEMLAWVKETLAVGQAVEVSDLAVEAAQYFERGIIYRAQGKPDPFRCFELAYTLCPTNPGYASTYLGELQARWDQPLPLGLRCDYFLRALDVVRRLDPGMKGDCLPVPGFLLTMAPDPTSAPPAKVIVFPFAMTNRVGTVDAAEARRLFADALRANAHLDVLAGLEIDRLCAERGYLTAKNRILTAWEIACALGGASMIQGEIKTLANGRVRVGMGFHWSPWKATGSNLEGTSAEFESILGELAKKLAVHLVPGTGNPLTGDDDICREARRAAEDYYQRYCRGDVGWPDDARRNLWATICPVFFAAPEDALRELWRVSKWPGYDWSLAGHRFLSVGYWDTKKALDLWLAYLDELHRHPSMKVQLQARRAVLHRYDFFTPLSYPPGGERTEVCTRFYDWFCSEPVQRAYGAGEIDLCAPEFWRTFWYLDPATQEKYWDRTVTPRLLRLTPKWGDRIGEVYDLCSLLTRRFNLTKGDTNEAARILLHVAQVRETVKQALGDCEARRRAEANIQGVEDIVRGKPQPLAGPPDQSQPEISGAVLLFDYRRDLPEDLWGSWPVVGGTRFVVEKSRAWIGFTAAKNDRGPGLITIVSLDVCPRTCRVCPIKAPEVGSGFYRTPVLLAKAGNYICLAEFHNVLVVPLDDAGRPDAADALFLGPEQGMPATGLRKPLLWDNALISALAALGNDFYFGVCRPLLSGSSHPINYGGLFRWAPGEVNVTRVAACNSMETGAFNDCAPYMIQDAVSDETGRSLVLQVKQGPGIVQNQGRTVPWKYTPPATWESLDAKALPPAPTIPWRVTHAPDGKTFALEYLVNGKAKTWQVFPSEAFSPGELTVCEAGLLWVVYRQRPLIYFIPRESMSRQ